jgi:hypothetical protein
LGAVSVDHHRVEVEDGQQVEEETVRTTTEQQEEFDVSPGTFGDDGDEKEKGKQI